MFTSRRSSGSADWCGISLPASSRCVAGSCRSSFTTSLVGNGSSSSSRLAFSASKWRAGPVSAPAWGYSPTERPLPSDTYRWLYGCGHTLSSENTSSRTC